MTFIYTLATFRTPKNKTLLLKNQLPNTVREVSCSKNAQKLAEKEKGKKLFLISVHHMETEVERDVVRRQGHTRRALHIWALVTTLPSLSPVRLPRNHLSFPQKLGLPAPLGRRKRSLLSLQIHEPLFQKYTPSAMRWKTLLKS